MTAPTPPDFYAGTRPHSAHIKPPVAPPVNLVVLQPSWLTDEVARLLHLASKKEFPNGRLHHHELHKVWPQYEESTLPNLLQLMLGAEVVALARDGSGHSLGFSIVPSLLPDTAPRDIMSMLPRTGALVCLRVTLSRMPAQFLPFLHARLLSFLVPVSGSALSRRYGRYREQRSRMHELAPHEVVVWKPEGGPTAIQVCTRCAVLCNVSSHPPHTSSVHTLRSAPRASGLWLYWPKFCNASSHLPLASSEHALSASKCAAHPGAPPHGTWHLCIRRFGVMG